MNYKNGVANPLGATIMKGGVNFSLFSPFATEVSLLLFNDVDDVNPITINLNPKINKTYYYWHIFIEDIKENQLYGYRVDGIYNEQKGQRFDNSKVLLDPYSKAIIGDYDRKLAEKFGVDNITSCLKSAVISDDFDWEGITYPEFDISKAIIYEMHPAGMTKNPNSKLPEDIKGTYKGLLNKVPYLLELGINVVEFMPIFMFDIYDAPPDKDNYWGYSPINFFSPHPFYSNSKTPQEIVTEFKTLIKELHKNGIKVILDVVYNHTGENGYNGPNYSFRGIANSSYYMVDENGNYRDYSGCGNTINVQHSVMRRMIIDSLEYWSKEMQIDGFRFDLAAVLARDEQGNPMNNPPILWQIDSHPELANTILIAEAWDAAGLNYEDNFPGDRWLIWNGKFRDIVRRFVKGDLGISGDFAYRFLGGEGSSNSRYFEFIPKQHINFITAHDGYTLNDLVSYNFKHNWGNGEDNRDGSNDNHSWNCGFEGPTNDIEINNIRFKQIKNFLILNLLSHGTPMLLMGDEILRTQFGNNNAFCQDNEISWMNWSIDEKKENLLSFVSHILKMRKQFKLFSYQHYFSNIPQDIKPYFLYHRDVLNANDWYNYQSFSIEIVNPKFNERIIFLINMFNQDVELILPKGNWDILTTSSFKKYNLQDDFLRIEKHSILVLNEK